MPNDLMPIPTEAVFADIARGDMTIENEMRAAGKISEADSWQAARTARLQAQRADLGLPEPKVIDPREAKVADDKAQALTASPGDYRVDLSDTKMSEQGSKELNEALRSMAAANRLEKTVGNGFIDACITAATTVRGLDENSRTNLYDGNMRTINQRAGSPEKGKERIDIARAFLSRGGMNPAIADHLSKDPLVAELACQLDRAAKGT